MTVFAGPNGAGKSSLRSFIKDLGIEIDADVIAKERQLTDIQAGRETIRMFNDCLEKGISFSLETTLSGNLVLEQMRRAKERGFLIRLIYISLDSPLEHQLRVEQRASRGGHVIPPDDIERRFYRSHEHLHKAISIADCADIFNNSSKYQLISHIENGKVTK
ncbi:zeta toxin family protein [Alicyclobacillus fodiniaquatilis]|uniref:UDP-N-acetylglucosamine kinase n=1 Tax=Alicyclobacillus fodiniaquatilis TaxID=1661150 RepID=A0ABW4JDC5_9BACL